MLINAAVILRFMMIPFGTVDGQTQQLPFHAHVTSVNDFVPNVADVAIVYGLYMLAKGRLG